MTNLDELERLLATEAGMMQQFTAGAAGVTIGMLKAATQDVANFLYATAPAMIAEIKALRRQVAMSELIALSADEYDPSPSPRG